MKITDLDLNDQEIEALRDMIKQRVEDNQRRDYWESLAVLMSQEEELKNTYNLIDRYKCYKS
jgi:hypothetical protein